MICHILRGELCEIDKDLHLYEMMDSNIRSMHEYQLMLELSGSEQVLIATIIS